MTHLGSMITAKGVAPIAPFQQRFANTYLYGSYSPIDGHSFVCELEHVDSQIFEYYLKELSKDRPQEYKIVIIDNARFHSTKNIKIPENIKLVNIPPYTPELNPCEQIWKFIKQDFKNRAFENIKEIKKWLHEFVDTMESERIKSIVSNKNYIKIFNTAF